MKNIRVVVLGTINIDHFAYVERIPDVGESIGDASYYRDYGGKGLNISIALRRLGFQVSLIGCVGKDFYGKEILDFLKKEDVDVSNIKIVDSDSGIAFIIVQRDGRKAIISVPGANYFIDPNDIDHILSSMENYDMLIATLGTNLEAVKRALEISKKRNIKTLLVPSPLRKVSREFLEDIVMLSDIIILNEVEFRRIFVNTSQISLNKDPSRIIGESRILNTKTVVVTRSELGALIYSRGVVYEIPSYKNNKSIIDTTGAGDAFTAGFIYGYLCIRDLVIAGVLGSINASLKISRKGSSSAMPYINELLNFLELLNKKTISDILSQRKCI
ncbi:MAG: carbohydrate kinase family protein [Sulfolobales archaeon]